jgi:methyltransferase
MDFRNPLSGELLAILATAGALLLMLAEMLVSRANERELRARGALEAPGDVYRTMAWAYPLAFVAPGLEGAWLGTSPGWTTIAGAALFVTSKALKFWAISALGTRWTFRVLVLPGAPLVTRGPYRWLRHPNYVAVVGEIVAFAVLVGAPVTGACALAGFGFLLWRRIGVEEQALGLGARR